MPPRESSRLLRLTLLAAALAAAACRGQPGSAGHGHGHGRGFHGAHGEAAGPRDSSVTFTLFSATHELYIEIAPAFAAGKPSALTAHVTRLRDYQPVTRGRLTINLLEGQRRAATVTAAATARAGIFTPRLTAPAAGHYRMAVTFEDPTEATVSRWNTGEIVIAARPGGAGLDREGEIRFLKESQWSIPFRVAQPLRRRVTRTLTVPATVSPDPRFTHGLSASAAGRVEWATESTVTVVGATVRRGQPIGRLVPAAAAEHWSTLRQESEVARIERQRAAAELERVSALARDGLVPARRLQEAQTSLAKAEATLRAAREREAGLRGRAAAVLPLPAPADGTVVALHVNHGHRVAAGELLAEVASAEEVLVRATVFQLDVQELEKVHWAQVRRPGMEQPVHLADAAAALLTRRIVVDPRTLSAPLAFPHRQGTGGPLRLGDLVELTLGVGEPIEALTVPAGAVIELGTEPYLFLMVTGESFTRRRVRLGPSDGERVAVLEGLDGSERVVTIGALDVYLSSVAGSLETHQHQ